MYLAPTPACPPGGLGDVGQAPDLAWEEAT